MTLVYMQRPTKMVTPALVIMPFAIIVSETAITMMPATMAVVTVIVKPHCQSLSRPIR